MALFDDDNPFSNPYFGSENEELLQLLSDPNLDPKTREMAKRVRSLEKTLTQAGYSPEVAEPRESFFGEVLDTLDAPRQGVAGILDTALRGDMFAPGVGLGFERGQEENVTFSDILRRHDVIDNPIARGMVGFVGDIALDPLTYLTLGSGNAARVGGRALTESGIALRGVASERLLASGIVNDIDRSNKLDEAFRSAARYQESSKIAAATDSDATRLLELDNMAKYRSGFEGIINPDELAGEIFEKTKLRIGANVPFLGHLTGGEKNAATEIIDSDPGPVGQALRLAGKVWTPGRLKFAELEVSDEALNAFDNVRMYGNARLADLGTFLANRIEEASQLPVIGAPIKGAASLAKAGAQRASNALSAANKLFLKTFYQKALIGADAHNNRLDFFNFKEGAKLQARDKTYKALGEEIIADKALQREIFLTIDGQATGSLRDRIKPDSQQSQQILELLNKVRQGTDVSEGDQIRLRNILAELGVEDDFRSRMNALMADPRLDARLKDGITKTMQFMDDIALEEARAGLGYSMLEYYVPHRYKNLDNADSEFIGNRKDFFMKARKFETISEAFKVSGKVADTDLASLMQYRAEKSLVLRAQRDYAQRLMIEEGLNPMLVSKVYREALMNPSGDAAKALRRHRIELKHVDTEAITKGVVDSERLQVYSKMGLKQKLDPTELEMIAQSASDYQAKVHEELWSAGLKPRDNRVPMSALGELGDEIEMPGGEKMFLPKPIADSYKEAVAARDYFKEAFGTSAFGKAALGVLDHTTSIFKKLITLPFPAYWAQNFFGDRFNQLMQGPNAMDPGIFARTYSVMAGKSAIRSKSGMVLDKPTLDRVIKQFGMAYTVDDFLGTTKSFGDMNIDRFLAQKNTLGENLKKITTKGNRQAARDQVLDAFNKGFDGYFRVSHFVHRFEQGDSIADAVRASQQAYFNYRDMSAVESSLFRRFYMFYGYMSQATKQSLTSLVTRPANLTMQLHGVNALAEFFSDPDAAPTAEMHEAKLLDSLVTNEQLSRVVGRSKETGRPIIGRGFAAPLNAVMQQFSLQMPRNLSVGELMDTAGDNLRRTIQKQFASSNPMLNASMQIVSGKNLYFDRPLDSEFLRKVPDLTAAAEALAGFAHTDLPITLNDTVKDFLDAVPDGKGRLIANPQKMWILMNVVPGLSRATSMGGTLTNTDLPLPAKALRTLVGVNLQDADPSRTYLAKRREELEKFIDTYSLRQQLRNRETDQ